MVPSTKVKPRDGSIILAVLGRGARKLIVDIFPFFLISFGLVRGPL